MDKAYNIYVDSALRTSGTNSDFTFQTTPNKYIQSKAKVAVLSMNWQNTIYQINSSNNTINFSVVTVNGTVTNYYTATIDPGNYNYVELINTVKARMNYQTSSNNVSIPQPYINQITYKISWRKYTPGDTGALPNEIVGIYNLLPTSTAKSILGFDSTLSFGNAYVESPYMLNLYPIDYFYLVSPNVQSSSFAQNIGGNGILYHFRPVTARNTLQVEDNDNIHDNLLDCSYIPMQWSFRLVDKFGQPITQTVPFNFVLRIIPE